MKKNVIYAAAASLVLGFASCSDELNGDERFMANPNPPVQDTTGFVKRFVVEDFTGQNCINCPSAAAMLADEKENTYGDRMILVAMHAGGLSYGTPLHNEVAQTYMDALGLKNNPAISVDRQYNDDISYVGWSGPIAERALVEAVCEVTPFVSITGERSFQMLSLVEFAENVDDSLGVLHWILEDSIQSYQVSYEPDTENYIHNHVFRDCLNRTWGEQFANGHYEAGVIYSSEITDEYTLPEGWDEDNVSVVSLVFRYSDNSENPIAEILQANVAHLDFHLTKTLDLKDIKMGATASRME